MYFWSRSIISLNMRVKIEYAKKKKMERLTTSKDLLEWIRVLLFHLPNYITKYICNDL